MNNNFAEEIIMLCQAVLKINNLPVEVLNDLTNVLASVNNKLDNNPDSISGSDKTIIS